MLSFSIEEFYMPQNYLLKLYMYHIDITQPVCFFSLKNIGPINYPIKLYIVKQFMCQVSTFFSTILSSIKFRLNTHIDVDIPEQTEILKKIIKSSSCHSSFYHIKYH